jgi:hypothetical protein
LLESNNGSQGAGYVPFAGFDEWRRLSVDQQTWDALVSRLKVSDADADLFARARDVAKRAAAIESGAIEGLYPVDRGFTITVATQLRSGRPRLKRERHAFGA